MRSHNATPPAARPAVGGKGQKKDLLLDDVGQHPAASRASRRARIAAADLPAFLDRLETLTIDGLRLEWQRCLPTPVPAIASRDVLRHLIAWRVQARVHGGFDPETARRLKQLMADHAAQRPLAIRLRARLSPGTILSRDWKGRIHKVTVEVRGFSYDGKHYASLSEIARLITGTRWSGPRLFGLDAAP
jgi:hypothetical protein